MHTLIIYRKFKQIMHASNSILFCAFRNSRNSKLNNINTHITMEFHTQLFRSLFFSSCMLVRISLYLDLHHLFLHTTKSSISTWYESLQVVKLQRAKELSILYIKSHPASSPSLKRSLN